MQVTKRDGRREPVRFDKITQRLTYLKDLAPALDVDVTRVAASVCSAVHDGISTVRLDELAADVAAGLSTEHPGYGTLAARILVSNLQKNTSDSVLDTYERMADLLDPQFLAVVRAHADQLQAMVRYERDYDYDFFGFKTMEKLYLTRVDGVVVERPQHMWLRVAICLWGEFFDSMPECMRIRETYEYLSTRRFTHASPTLFNAGLKRQQLASCFLAGVEEDSIDGIFDVLTKCARISKYGGGIGLHVSGVRGKGAHIRGTNGESDGLVPMLRVANSVASYVNQVTFFSTRRSPCRGSRCAPRRPGPACTGGTLPRAACGIAPCCAGTGVACAVQSRPAWPGTCCRGTPAAGSTATARLPAPCGAGSRCASPAPSTARTPRSFCRIRARPSASPSSLWPAR